MSIPDLMRRFVVVPGSSVRGWVWGPERVSGLGPLHAG
jgi:hypothetical protein